MTEPPDAPSVAEPDAATIENLLPPLLDAAYATALRLTRRVPDAEDLVHDAVVHACRGFASFRPGTNFRAWFLRILTNCFYTRYRRQQREGTAVPLDDTPELYLYSRTAELGLHDGHDPAGMLMDRLDTELVARALDALPDEYRVVCTLYFVHDLAYQDIATAVGVPIGTVRSRLHRGRRQLQRALWRLADDRGIASSLKERS